MGCFVSGLASILLLKKELCYPLAYGRWFD